MMLYQFLWIYSIECLMTTRYKWGTMFSSLCPLPAGTKESPLEKFVGVGFLGGINLDWVLRERGWEGVDWIHLAQDRDQWRTGVNTVMNLRIP
jgi:hypothetical protein